MLHTYEEICRRSGGLSQAEIQWLIDQVGMLRKKTDRLQAELIVSYDTQVDLRADLARARADLAAAHLDLTLLSPVVSEPRPPILKEAK